MIPQWPSVYNPTDIQDLLYLFDYDTMVSALRFYWITPQMGHRTPGDTWCLFVYQPFYHAE